VIPSARRVAVLADETDPFSVLLLAQISKGSRSLGIQVRRSRRVAARGARAAGESPDRRHQAYNELVSLAEEQHRARNITPAMAFAEALSDPKNRELAAKALARPMPTTSYPFPR
jgi:hypothetical protein